MSGMVDLDKAHDLISMAIAKEAEIRLKRYVDSIGPDKKTHEMARIAASNACKSVGSYLAGDMVILERKDAIKIRDDSAELPTAKARIEELERELALRTELCVSLQKKKKSGKKKR